MEKILSYLTRPSCHLCADGLGLVENLSQEFGFTLEQINIDLSDELTMAYGLRIPVVKDARGNVLAEGVIVRRRLKKAIRKAARTAGQHSNRR